MSNDIYYVYIHRRLTDNLVFYVGKGKGRRAHTTHGRNIKWKRTYAKHGRSVEIIFDNLDEETAFQCEIDTIKEFLYFNQPLCNLTQGGEGVSNPAKETRERISYARKDKNIYTFTNEQGVCTTGTRYDIAKFYGMKAVELQKAIANRVKNNGVGVVLDGDSVQQAVARLFPNRTGKNNLLAIKDKLRLVNDNHHVLQGIRVEIAKQQSWWLPTFGRYINNPTGRFKGYVLVRENETDEQALSRTRLMGTFDKNTYRFLNVITLEEHICTRHDLRVLTGVNVEQLFSNSIKRKTVKNFAIMFEKETVEDVLKRIKPTGNTDFNNYVFKNESTGEIFKGTRLELSKHTCIELYKFKALFYKTPHKSTQGWSLIKELNE